MSQYKIIALACLSFVAISPLCAQQIPDLKVAGRDIQIHAFASQGFDYSTNNNWLTMDTTSGSPAMTDFGVNVSTQITDKFRVGAQMYDRNIGQLGQWHPTLDWAQGDYRFKDWFGIRAGKVKTTLGLFNDTQDMDFLQTFAVLPQSIYPIDLRDSTIAHVGGDAYGNINAKKLGTFSYTIYGGERQDSQYGGYPYALKQFSLSLSSYGGPQFGQDLRWTTPVKGLLVGASHLSEYITGTGTRLLPNGRSVPSVEHTANADTTTQFYTEYSYKNLRLDGEYRRYWRDHILSNPTKPEAAADSRSWYTSAAYRVSKRLELGTYYSRFISDWRLNADLPNNHIYDKVVTARIDLKSYWNFKIEGHFMDGYGATDAVRGFYPQQNPNGFKPTTNMLVLRTGVSF